MKFPDWVQTWPAGTVATGRRAVMLARDSGGAVNKKDGPAGPP